MRFVKGHGTENDFVVLPDPDGDLDLTTELVARICDRWAGIGADGVLRVVLTAAVPEVAHLAGEARWFMDYRNADGSIAEMCGNGARVYARYLVTAGYATPGRMSLATRGGIRAVSLGPTGDVTVGMGRALLPPGEVKVAVEGGAWPGTLVDMGNPHVVVLVDELAAAGPLLEPPVVTPSEAVHAGTNVEFVVERGPEHIALRVHERGVGETRSCGTGACAAMVAVSRRHDAMLPRRYTVDVPGGRLTVAQDADGELSLTGPAVLVASGELEPGWLHGS